MSLLFDSHSFQNPAALAVTGEVSEIFSSIQGEGPLAGVRQIFVRFGRCNMKCAYCDEADKMKPGAYRAIPVSAIVGRIAALERENGPHHSVSLTGGEPLAYPGAIEALLDSLKNSGLGIYLETNGTLWKPLKRVLPGLTMIAMDLKPPTATMDRSFWDEHRKFLEASAPVDLFVKLVVTPGTADDEIEYAARIVAETRPEVPFFLQPVTVGGRPDPEAERRIREHWLPLCASILRDCRTLPQQHKIWGIR